MAQMTRRNSPKRAERAFPSAEIRRRAYRERGEFRRRFPAHELQGNHSLERTDDMTDSRAKVNTWTDREGNPKAGLSVTADALLTAYHMRRKRQAMAGETEAMT